MIAAFAQRARARSRNARRGSSVTSAAPAPAPAVGAVRAGSVLAAITAVALLLRLTSLSRGLFSDEAYSLALAQRGFGHMLALFGYEANGTPYPIVLWPLIRVFGDSEGVLRLPAVLAGAASVPALWWAARRYVSQAGALLAAALLAVNPMAVFYGHQARPYAFVVLAGCLAFGFWPRALRAHDTRTWVGYVVSMTALAYCDILAAPIVIPAQAMIVARESRDGRSGWRRWAYALAATAVCCIPLLLAAAIARSRRNALYWLPKTDRSLVTLALQEFTAGLSGVTAARWVTLLAGVALVAAAVWVARRRAHAPRPTVLSIALCWGLAPIALLLIVSFAAPVFWPRYAIVALPGLCLLAAAAAERLWNAAGWRVLCAGCLAVVFAASLVAVARQRTVLQENWPPIAGWLSVDRRDGQPVIVDNALVLPALGYYDHAFRARDGDLVVQEWHDRPLPAGVVGFKDRTGYGSVPDGPPSASTIARLARAGHGTVWMVVADVDAALQSDPRTGAAVAWARAHCHVQIRTAVGVWAMRASGCATAPA
jgi:mannosyltransferase